jgi:hypothetical protein
MYTTWEKANLSIARVTFNESKWSKDKIVVVVMASPSPYQQIGVMPHVYLRNVEERHIQDTREYVL